VARMTPRELLTHPVRCRGLGPHLRPAPARLPPHVGASRSSSSSCRLRFFMPTSLTSRCVRSGHTRNLNCAMFFYWTQICGCDLAITPRVDECKPCSSLPREETKRMSGGIRSRRR
jgi:hypothetical protein